MSTAKVKARKAYGNGNYMYKTALKGVMGAKEKAHYILPADAASVERMVEQMVSAMREIDGNGTDFARASLAAIGVKCTKNNHDAKTCLKNKE